MRKKLYISIVCFLSLLGVLVFQTSSHHIISPPKKYVALTFDDGPNEGTTPILLDILKSKSVHATFFMVGEHAQQFSGTVKRVYDEGHMIGNHTWNHKDLRGLSGENIVDEVKKTQDIINKITGRSPTVFRPPYGSQNKAVLQTLYKLHLASIQWSLDTNDWKGLSSESLVQSIMDKVQPGSIILMHDTLSGTVQAMPQIIDALENSGYTMVTVDKLLGGYKHIHPGRIYRKG